VIVDTSALIAILRDEPEAEQIEARISWEVYPAMSAANYFEAAIVVDSQRNPAASRNFDDFMDTSGIDIRPVTKEHAELARAAYRDFGKGSGHPARLNFGDCFAYALAEATGEPLLYKGDDFRRTGVRSAL
jgi:ribonuclease VapC